MESFKAGWFGPGSWSNQSSEKVGSVHYRKKRAKVNFVIEGLHEENLDLR